MVGSYKGIRCVLVRSLVQIMPMTVTCFRLWGRLPISGYKNLHVKAFSCLSICAVVRRWFSIDFVFNEIEPRNISPVQASDRWLERTRTPAGFCKKTLVTTARNATVNLKRSQCKKTTSKNVVHFKRQRATGAASIFGIPTDHSLSNPCSKITKGGAISPLRRRVSKQINK